METVGAWVSSDPIISGFIALALVLLILWWGQAAWKKVSPDIWKKYGNAFELFDEISRVRSRITALPSMDNWPEAEIAIRWAQWYLKNGRMDAARDELERAKALMNSG